jgi:glycosyltransferase involved in cell wall biosynthesis
MHKTTMMIDVGVDVGKFRPSSGEHVSHNQVTFLAAGRLEARKGLRLLVDAFALLMAEHPEARLRIVGDGPERRRLEEQINARGLDNAVALIGAVGHDEMRREFETAEVFVFPSLRDTSGAVVLEAMAMSLPIICLDHQGAAIMVADGCGIKIQPGTYPATIKAMRDALARLASDPDLRNQLGANARRRAQEKFSWDEKFERMIKIYQSVVRTEAKFQ